VSVIEDPNFDPAREVALPLGPSLRAHPDFKGTSRIVAWQPDRVVIEAQLNRPGYVVLVDAFDPGWRATLGGRPVEILRGNFLFRCIAAPAGTQRIELCYRPRAAIVGAIVSFLTAAVLLGLVVARGLRRDGEGSRRPAQDASIPTPGAGQQAPPIQRAIAIHFGRRV